MEFKTKYPITMEEAGQDFRLLSELQSLGDCFTRGEITKDELIGILGRMWLSKEVINKLLENLGIE